MFILNTVNKYYSNKIKTGYKEVILFFILIVCFAVNITVAQPLAKNKIKFVGNVVGNTIRTDLKKYWNQVTPENAGKWGSVEYAQGQYNWTLLDNIYNYAITNGFPYKHHTLVWGQQSPGFINSLDSATQYQEVENWIKNSGDRYPDADFCDVVNEPLHAPPAYKNALGGDGATGWDWVIKTFELARQYWPNTKLHINEYSVINDASANARYLVIINLLKERGLIDGIGVQGHHFEVDGGASVSTLQTNLNKLTATGLPVYITELDINQQSDDVQLQRYKSIFPMLYENPGVHGITIWGYVIYQTWRDYTYLLGERGVERPALQWLRTYLGSPFKPVLASPLNGTTGEPRDPVLTWFPSDSAITYNVQIAKASNFSTLVLDTTVSDTLLKLEPLEANTKYYWRVNASNDSLSSDYSAAANFTTGEIILDVENPGSIPTKFELAQNYPNPFNPSTKISYSVPQPGYITLKVYNLLGEQIVSLIEGFQPAGNYNVTFDGSMLTSGIYLYQLKAENFIETKKLVLLK